eukprot:scaffold8430_cov122-Skeletonema_marinoi.AAC.5
MTPMILEDVINLCLMQLTTYLGDASASILGGIGPQLLNSAGNQGGFDIIVEFQAGGIDFLHELSEVIELRTKSRQNQK